MRAVCVLIHPNSDQKLPSRCDESPSHVYTPAKCQEDADMPAKSEKQRRFMAAELSRRREGQQTETGMSESQLLDFVTSRKQKEKRTRQ